MKIGFLFPGQGAQCIGMGKDLYEKYPEYRDIYEKVNEITGRKIDDLTYNSTEEILSQTKNTQIAILTMSLAILEILKKENIQVEAAMGLSLGEYTALIHSGAISFEDGIKIVQKRGELMQNLCPTGDWSMAAIMGLDEAKTSEVCASVTSGFVTPANYNCPGQIVISGEKNAVLEAIEKCKQEGAKRAIELNTSGPFHTCKLTDASEALKKELASIEIGNFNTKVIKNIDGKPYESQDDVKEILANHIINPVRFADGLQKMLDMGIDTFVEIGPGKTLSGFVKRTSKDVKILNINDVESLENVLNGGI